MESKPIKIFQWTSLKHKFPRRIEAQRGRICEHKSDEAYRIESTSITQRSVNSSIHPSKASSVVGLVEALLSKSRAMIHLRKLNRIVYGIAGVRYRFKGFERGN